jgi:hypothetical protein
MASVAFGSTYTIDLKTKSLKYDEPMAVGEIASVVLNSIGLNNPTNLVVYLSDRAGTPMALSTNFVANGTNGTSAIGTLSLATTNMIEAFVGKQALGEISFNMTVWNLVSSTMLSLSPIQVKNNPLAESLYIGSLDPIGTIDVLDAIARAGVASLSTSKIDKAGTDWVKFNTNFVDGVEVGRLQWDQDTQTLEVGLKSNVTMQIGQEMPVYVKNNSGQSVDNGMAVCIIDAGGTIPRIARASSTNAARSFGFAVATMDIQHGGTGYVTAFGAVHDMNTSAIGAEGVPVYLGATPGSMTTNMPSYPIDAIVMGEVTYAHSGNGIFFVNPRPVKTWAGLDGRYLPLSGGAMSGTLDMGANTITNVSGAEFRLSPGTAVGTIEMGSGSTIFDFPNLIVTNTTSMEAIALGTNSAVSNWPSLSGDYLPLAGGTVTGSLSVRGVFPGFDQSIYLKERFSGADRVRLWTDGYSGKATLFFDTNSATLGLTNGLTVQATNGNFKSLSATTTGAGTLTAGASTLGSTTVNGDLTVNGTRYEVTTINISTSVYAGTHTNYYTENQYHTNVSYLTTLVYTNVISTNEVSTYVNIGGSLEMGAGSTFNATGATEVTFPAFSATATGGVVAVSTWDFTGATVTGLDIPSQGVEDGATVTSLYTSTSSGYADTQIPNAGWVRSLLSSGRSIFFTTNLYPAKWVPTNTTGIGSYETPAVESWMTFAVTGAGQYVATMVDTNPIAAGIPIVGPATVHIGIYTASGANRAFSGKPELYYSYSPSSDTALTLGDFSAAPQSAPVGVSNSLAFALSWPTVVPTSTYYRVFRFRCTAKGQNTTNIQIAAGGSYASYVQMQESSAAGGGDGGATNIVGGSYSAETRTLTGPAETDPIWTNYLASTLTNLIDSRISTIGVSVTNLAIVGGTNVTVQTNGTSFIVSAAGGGAEPYRAYADLTIGAGGTATVEVAHGNLVRIPSTNSPVTLIFGTYPTVGVSKVWLSIERGTNSFSLNTNQVPNWNMLNIEVSTTNEVLFTRVRGGVWSCLQFYEQ